MPEAVQHYAEDKDMEKAIEIQQAIIETYRDDFSKYANQSELVRLQKVFDSVPLYFIEQLPRLLQEEQIE